MKTDGYSVYSSRSRLAKVAAGRSIKARKARHARFFPLTGVTAESRIVDIGCGLLGLRALEPKLNITGLDWVERPEYPGPFVVADATQPLPFEDNSFDLAYSNSLIEHLPPQSWPGFASELKRIARGFFVQTPAFSFPIEPHALLPAAHWLPPTLRKRYWKLGASDPSEWAEIQLLRRRDMSRLFCPPLAEKWGPLTKSWVCISAPDR